MFSAVTALQIGRTFKAVQSETAAMRNAAYYKSVKRRTQS